MYKYILIYPDILSYIIILRDIPEVRLNYKCVCIIYAYHGDIRALLPGSNCDIHMPGVLFIPKIAMLTNLAEIDAFRPSIRAVSVPLVTHGQVSVREHPRGCPG